MDNRRVELVEIGKKKNEKWEQRKARKRNTRVKGRRSDEADMYVLQKEISRKEIFRWKTEREELIGKEKNNKGIVTD